MEKRHDEEHFQAYMRAKHTVAAWWFWLQEVNRYGVGLFGPSGEPPAMRAAVESLATRMRVEQAVAGEL